MLLATSINGVIFGLFSGQPMLILGPTGPFLIFEEMLYLVTKPFKLENFKNQTWLLLFLVL
jgi:MFS superfamily sulfate permease-like transporter